MATDNDKLPAVLFDLDGTLIDSVYEHVRAWHATLRHTGIVIPAWKIHRRIGMSGKSFVRELLRETAPVRHPNHLDGLENGHDARFARAIRALQPLPGANDLLRHLHRSKVPIAIATTGTRSQTSLLLKKLKIPSGTPVLTGDDVKNAKPAPDIFVAAAQTLQVAMSDCLVVSDSVWVAAGRKGALGVGFLSGGYGPHELEQGRGVSSLLRSRDMLLHLEQLGLPGVS